MLVSQRPTENNKNYILKISDSDADCDVKPLNTELNPICQYYK